jgi:uncharacterized protein (DUF1697 family)
MTRFVAFLRAINVGGHTVTMAELRAHFEAVGLANVETFIASGNVLFDAPSRSAVTLPSKIEARLAAALGYEVKTFLRTAAEVEAIARYTPFPEARLRTAAALNVAFLAAPLGRAARKTLAALATDIDDLHAHGREVYWLCARKQSESTFSNAVFERRLGVAATFRGMNTIARLAAKLGAARAAESC